MSLEPVLDRDHLSRYTLGDEQLEREVLGLFIGQVPETLAALDAAADSEGRFRAVHTLKGSARAVGAVRLARVAERTERVVRDGGDLAGLREELEAAFGDVRAAILEHA
jgi:HPt (histidine-containing phosphotransfer) domain-containing protein